MKAENWYAIAEVIRSLTPYGFCATGLAIILCGIANGDKLIGDRFLYVIGSATGLFGAASGGFSPGGKQSPQNRIAHADQVEIDQTRQ